MPFVVPGVCRFAINGRMGGRDIVNVLDYFLETTGTTTARAGSCNDMAGILINQWTADILNKLSVSYSFNSVSWVDLDSASGSTGVRTTSGANSLPTLGSIAGDALPPNVAQLVTKATTSQRGRRNGRLYLCGMPETDTSGGNLGLTRLNAWETSWAAFRGNTNQTVTGVFAYTSALSVVHILTRDASGDPLTGEHSVVSALSPQQLLATQRRRLRS
jgi:hypothetical protein